jgi:uncharacterized protein YlxW (UPF0749 family)
VLTEKQEQAVKEAIPDLYTQLADLQEQVAKLQQEKQDLTELLQRMDSFDNWRRALRLRLRQEGSAT